MRSQQISSFEKINTPTGYSSKINEEISNDGDLQEVGFYDFPTGIENFGEEDLSPSWNKSNSEEKFSLFLSQNSSGSNI